MIIFEFEIRNFGRVLHKLERLVFSDFRSRRKPAAEPQVNQKARVNRPVTVINGRRDFVNEPPFQFAWDTTGISNSMMNFKIKIQISESVVRNPEFG